MKASPIHLHDYFVTELSLSATPTFDAKKDVPIRLEDFQVGVEAKCLPEKKRDWQMILRLTFQPPAEANVPYRFTVEIVGFFLVQDGIAEERVERIIKVNGASMLYGALREIVRDTTARGPYSPMLLPSTSFYEPQPQPAPAPAPDTKAETTAPATAAPQPAPAKPAKKSARRSAKPAAPQPHSK
jgi:preprotein translocase subunit SecB